ncbi:MAG: hypothetical protein ACLFRD_08615 [Nitriliruptoraceae bacterium]
MPRKQAKSATQTYPVTFKVTNTGKRPRTRIGKRFPGRRGNEDPEPVEVTVRNRSEYLKLKGCKDLQLAKAPAKSGGAKAAGSEDS